ncbi:MAG: IPT/TIG domain-containing protein, partial [Xanthomonadaceae bacterium]|nr:IPT/TIG domain-containing protein [Xanthomonadaceae bacterium]
MSANIGQVLSGYSCSGNLGIRVRAAPFRAGLIIALRNEWMKHQVGTDAIAGRKPSVGGALRARVQRVFSGLRAGLCGWWWLVLLAGFPAAAEATDFFYDVNGRLVAVTNDGGQSARYRYDAMGNLVRIDRLAVGELALFGFAPARGAAGSQVKIRGQGFSASPAGNTVRFDGVLSSVVSSTATELVAVVPGGAGTGPVSVT